MELQDGKKREEGAIIITNNASAPSSIKVMEEIELVLSLVRDKTGGDDESFLHWLTNEITAFALPVESTGTAVSINDGDLIDPSHVHELVIDALEPFASNEFVQRDGLKVFTDLTCNKGDAATFRVAIAREGGIGLIMKAMKKFPDNVQLQLYGCSALGNLVVENEANHVSIVGRGGIQSVVQAMTKFPNNKALQSSGCCTLGNLSSIEEHSMPPTVPLPSAIQVVLGAMKRFPNDQQLQQDGCFALGNLSCHSDEKIHSGIALQGGIESVIAAMTTFSDNEQLQLCGSLVIGSLAQFNEHCAAITNNHGIELVVQAMKSFTNNERLLGSCCNAFANFTCNLTCNSQENRISIGKQGGIDLVIQALTKFPNDELLQCAGCCALGNLAFCMDDNRVSITNNGGLGLAISAMERFTTNEPLQAFCCCVLGGLASKQVENDATVCLRLVIGAMKEFPSSNIVLRNACGALELWANVSFKCRQHVQQLGGVDFARHAWDTVLSKESKIKLKSEISTIANRFIFDDTFLLTPSSS